MNVVLSGVDLRRLHREGWGHMQPIDAGYLYEIGAAIRPLRNLAYETVPGFKAWGILNTTKEAVQRLLQASIYANSLKQAHVYGAILVDHIDRLLARINAPPPNNLKDVSMIDMLSVHRAVETFEPVLIAELQSASIFYVPARGAFDTSYLVNAGEALFPADLDFWVSEAVFDVQQGARALAFGLWTAAGYHFHRANEAVLRVYYDHHMPDDAPRGETDTMEKLAHKMKTHKRGDRRVNSALYNLIKLHRNPLIHPQQSIEDEDGAISLYTAIRSTIGYMIADLSGSIDNPTPWPEEASTPVVTLPPPAPLPAPPPENQAEPA